MLLVCGLLTLVRPVIDILDRHVQLVFVPFRRNAVLSTEIDQHPRPHHAVLIEKRDHLVIEQACQRRLNVDPVSQETWSEPQSR